MPASARPLRATRPHRHRRPPSEADKVPSLRPPFWTLNPRSMPARRRLRVDNLTMWSFAAAAADAARRRPRCQCVSQVIQGVVRVLSRLPSRPLQHPPRHHGWGRHGILNAVPRILVPEQLNDEQRPRSNAGSKHALVRRDGSSVDPFAVRPHNAEVHSLSLAILHGREFLGVNVAEHVSQVGRPSCRRLPQRHQACQRSRQTMRR
jgi:hypothetical protein